MLALQAKFDLAEPSLWQLESEPLSQSPVAPWHAKPTGNVFYEDYSGLQDQAPDAVVNWDLVMKGQTYNGLVPVRQPTSELPSCRRRSSHEHFSTPGSPIASHSQSSPDTTVNKVKRARCMHTAVNGGIGLRSGTLQSTSASDHSSAPWRKCMRRGFLSPAATSCSEDDASLSGACAPVNRQVMSFARCI